MMPFQKKTAAAVVLMSMYGLSLPRGLLTVILKVHRNKKKKKTRISNEAHVTDMRMECPVIDGEGTGCLPLQEEGV